VPPAPPDGDRRTDPELIEAMNSGDVRAFEALYDRHAPWAARVARRFARDEASANDAVQEAFMELLRRFPGFVLTSRLTTFLYPVVKHAALAQQRKHGREASEPIPERATTDEARDVEPGGLERALGALSDEQREVLLMHVVDGLTLAEVGVALGVPLGTVKSRLHAALTRLRADERTKRHFEE